MTEPTCVYCGITDKHRCRTQLQADNCTDYQCTLNLEELSKTITKDTKPRDVTTPKLALSESLGLGEVSVSTHHHGVLERISLQFHHFPTVNLFNMSVDEIDKLIQLLQMVRDYSKKGKL